MKQAPHFADTTAAVHHAQEATGRATTKIEEAKASTTKSQDLVRKQTETLLKLDQAVQDKGVLKDLVLQAKLTNDELTKELSTTQAALTAAYTELGTVKGDLGTAQYTIQQHEEEMKKVQARLDRAAITDRKYHRLKFGAIALAEGLVALLLWKFKAVLLPLGYIGIGIMVGLPVLVFTTLLFLL